MSIIWAFDPKENKHTLNRGKYCIKKFWASLREHTKNINDFEKKKMLLLLKEKLKSEKLKSRWKNMIYLLKKNLKKFSKSIIYPKVRDHCHCTGKNRDAPHSTCNLKFNVSNKISTVLSKETKVTRIDKYDN